MYARSFLTMIPPEVVQTRFRRLNLMVRLALMKPGKYSHFKHLHRLSTAAGTCTGTTSASARTGARMTSASPATAGGAAVR